MANFTADEIQSAVENLVQSTIRRPYDTLGVRRTDVSFTDIQQAAAGVFMLYPKAPFYCLSLGAKALLQLIEAEAQTITSLLEAISAVGRRVLPVDDVSPLFNAKVALEGLARAVLEKNTVRDVTTTPSYQQFEKNVSTFLEKNGDTVKEAGEIVDTPQGARKKLATLVQQLQDQHEVIIERVKYLANGEDDYASVNLAGIVAQTVLTKAASVVEAHANELAALKPEERLSNMRKVILDLITARSVVKRYGSFTGPTKVYAVTGTGTPYSDASHPSQPATVKCDLPGPYEIGLTNNTLELYLEGSLTPTTLSLPYSYWCRIDGAVNEITQTEGTGWIIGDGFNPLRNALNEGGSGDENVPNNDALRISIFGVPLNVSLTHSADGDGANIDATPRTAQQICDDINPVINPFDFEAVPYLAPRKFYGLVNIAPVAGAQGTLTLVGGFGNFGTVGITIGMLVNVLDGTEAGLWLIDAVASTVLTATRVDAAAVVGATSSTIEVGPKERRIRIQPTDTVAALTSQQTLEITYNATNNQNGASTLGLVPGVLYKSRPSTAKDLANFINGATTLATASTEFNVNETWPARSNASDSMKLTISYIRQTATSTVWDGSSLTVTMIGALAAGVTVGSWLVERSGANIGTIYNVTSVSDTQVVASYYALGAPSSQTYIDVEIGPFGVANLSSYQMVRINTGQNTGDYYIEKAAFLDLTLTSPLPTPADVNTGLELKFDVDIGPEYLVLASANKTTASHIKVGGTVTDQLFNVGAPAITTGVYGVTKYFKLPQKVAVGNGDLLLLYGNTTTYAEPSASFNITAAESGLILTLDGYIESNVNWVFGPNATIPFAKLQTGHTFDFAAFQRKLNTWIARSVQQTSYFTDLARYINPLIVNSSPTAVQVGDAANRINDLSKYLTIDFATLYGGTAPIEESVKSYVADYQTAVDALLRSFKEKGADRAYDFLIQGRFSEFFAMDLDTSSYAGAMQKAMRDVVMNDLSISKTNRKDQKVSRLLSSVSSPDPEYNLDDTEQATPDPAGQGEF